MKEGRLVGKVLLVFGFAVLQIIAGTVGQAAATEKMIKVGLPFPISGPAAGWGIPISRAVELVAEKINTEGGINVKGETYRFQTIVADTKMMPEVSTAAAHKLVYDNKVAFIVGGITGDESLPMQVITEKEKILSFCGGWADVITPDKPYAYRIYLSLPEMDGPLFIRGLEQHPEVKRIAYFGTDGISGHWAAEYHKENILPRLGLEMVSEIYYQYGEKDFTPHLTKTLAARPGVMTFEGAPATVATIVKQARDMGYKGHFWVSNPPDENLFTQIAGKDYIEGYLTHVSVPADGPMATAAAKEIKQTYIDRYKEYTSMVLAGAYVYALPILKEAIEAAGSVDTERVREVLDSGTMFDTMFGPVTFGGKELYGIGHQVLHTLYVAEMRDGKVVVVDKVPPENIYDWVKLPLK
jgi:branched-chain amino acid transport system substrate-binding protein